MERETVCAIGAPLAAVLISKLVFDFLQWLVDLKTKSFIAQSKIISMI